LLFASEIWACLPDWSKRARPERNRSGLSLPAVPGTSDGFEGVQLCSPGTR
jgi:hypothetical protein